MAIKTSGLVSEWLGKRANEGAVPTNSPAVTSWSDLVGGNDGSFQNWAGTLTDTEGWDGDGTEGDPYSLYLPTGTTSDNAVACGSSDSLNLTDAITTEMWFRAESGGHQYGRLFRRRVGSAGYLVYADTINNQVRFSTTYSTSGDLDQLFTPGITVVANWHHLVFTYDSTTHALWCYVNGGSTYASGYSGTVQTMSGTIVSASGEVATIGNNTADKTRPFCGRIATIRIYDHALSEAEVYANFLEGKIGESGIGLGTAPTVLTSAISNITANTASGGGIITDEGSDTPTAYGVCWNTGGSPTIADDHTDDS